MNDISSNKELFEKLKKIEKLESNINFVNNIINIVFHKDFQISIIFKRHFKVYINDIFYYDIEGQDIFESMAEIVNDKWIFIDKSCLLHKKKIMLISKNSFNIQEEISKSKNINKIFSINELIYDNTIF